jgi:hypothetical protein
MEGGSLYTLQDVPGKGKGLIATVTIPKGTRILEEQPIITTPERQRSVEWLETHVSQQVASLNEHQRQSFLSMHNIYPHKNTHEQYLGILRTNGLPVEDNGIDGGIFLEACRINHDCHNNAQKHWNERIQRHTVHALRDIAEGEEITVYYLGLDSSREVRRQKLQERFGFLCSCQVCSLEPVESQKDDRIIARIDQLDDIIGEECMSLNFSLQTLRYVDERVRLYNEQRPGSPGVPRAYFDATQIFLANGDLARGRVFVERAVEGWRIAYGSDSKEVIDHTPFIRDPTKLPVDRTSTRWKTSLEETLPQLDSGDFEDWLWRREKPKAPGQPTSLRNRDIFPSFSDLPVKSRFHSGLLQSFGDRDRPSHHWCLLAEIVSAMTLHHLELQLTDIEHESFPLHFNTAGRGNEMESTKIREEYTVAVLYAKRRAFTYGDPGIDHVDPRMLKVCNRHPACNIFLRLLTIQTHSRSFQCH